MSQAPSGSQPWICPRCEETVDDDPASSRTQGDESRPAIYVCPACGTDETFLHEAGKDLPGPDAWPLKRRYGLGGQSLDSSGA